MKNLFVLIVFIFFGCGRKVVPVVGDGFFDVPEHRVCGFNDSVNLVQVEVFRLGGTDSFYRKVVLDSVWLNKFKPIEFKFDTTKRKVPFIVISSGSL